MASWPDCRSKATSRLIWRTTVSLLFLNNLILAVVIFAHVLLFSTNTQMIFAKSNSNLSKWVSTHKSERTKNMENKKKKKTIWRNWSPGERLSKALQASYNGFSLYMPLTSFSLLFTQTHTLSLCAERGGVEREKMRRWGFVRFYS